MAGNYQERAQHEECPRAMRPIKLLGSRPGRDATRKEKPVADAPPIDERVRRFQLGLDLWTGLPLTGADLRYWKAAQQEIVLAALQLEAKKKNAERK